MITSMVNERKISFRGRESAPRKASDKKWPADNSVPVPCRKLATHGKTNC
jgi:hypothetical protein